MRSIWLIALFLISFQLTAQHKVGVRAGLNYSSYNGPLEMNESYGVSSGFHFGVNYTYILPSKIGLRAELLYIQRGTKQSYQTDEGYYIINPIIPSNLESFVEIGKVDMDLDISSAFLSIPLTVNYRLTKGIEIFGGASIDFMVGPTAKGKVDFESNERSEDIRFIQSLDHNYGSDFAGEYNDFSQSNVIIRVDGELVTIPKVIGAYYNHTAAERERGDRLNAFNTHLIGGVNYFLNSGFYIGARYEYGLLDTTNDNADISLVSLDEEDNYIYREDFDQPFTISISFGFRF